MADQSKHIVTRYDDAGRYLGWGGEYYASKKAAQDAADNLNANLEEGDYLWAPDTEAAVGEYRAAYGEDGPPAEGNGDAEESADVEEVTDEPADEEAAEDDGAADE